MKILKADFYKFQNWTNKWNLFPMKMKTKPVIKKNTKFKNLRLNIEDRKHDMLQNKP